MSRCHYTWVERDLVDFLARACQKAILKNILQCNLPQLLEHPTVVKNGISAAQLATVKNGDNWSALHAPAEGGHLKTIPGGAAAEILEATTKRASKWVGDPSSFRSIPQSAEGRKRVRRCYPIPYACAPVGDMAPGYRFLASTEWLPTGNHRKRHSAEFHV